MKNGSLGIALVIILILGACDNTQIYRNRTTETEFTHVDDPHSFSNPNEAVVTHLSLSLSVDFENQVLSGIAEWDYLATDSAMAIYFDVSHLKVLAVRDELNGSLPYELGPPDPYLGQYLKVSIAGHPQRIKIKYATTDSSDALQWLTPSQTAGKRSPYLYTQSQPILCRSWIPCQDSPGIRFTYNAKIHAPKGFMAVMSAINPTEKHPDADWYTFKQPNPIPSYLMALAVGDIEYKPTGPRTGVYAEPIMLDTAAWEFGDLEKMLMDAEKIFGPYAWNKYDVLVLPPSFPYGGMENPMLTFATPTVLAGDKSLITLIAHEMAHSWSGNLVTDATWNDFWLNEGFTVYLERRLMESMYGKSYNDMLSCLGYEDLKATMEDMLAVNDTNNTKLKLSLEGKDPDEGLTDVAYEKGYHFLLGIERAVGRKPFDQFLRTYFEKFSFRSMTTERFIAELYANLIEKGSKQDSLINVHSWIYTPGMPVGFIPPHSDRFDRVDEVARKYIEGQLTLNQIDHDSWSSHEVQKFLRDIKNHITQQQMTDLDAEFKFTQSGNCEVLALWLESTARYEYKPAYPLLKKFLETVGRRKYLIPVYKAMLDNPNMVVMAKKIYREARGNYHSATTKTLDKMFVDVNNNKP